MDPLWTGKEEPLDDVCPDKRHLLEITKEIDHRNRKIRKRCVHCYDKHKQEGRGSKAARDLSKRVRTFCSLCPSKPHICLDCFNTIHVKYF
jgi:hypothetical protein